MTTTSFRTRLAYAAALSVLATTALTACGGTSSNSAGADSGKPVSGGTLTFYDPVEYNAWTSDNSLWSNSQVADNLGERLIWQDSDTGEFRPWLAKSWEISPDRLTYTFHLKPGITFSNGDPLDAATVKINFDQLANGDEKLGIPANQFWGQYAGTQVVDPLTLKVSLKTPDASFLQVLSNYRASTILSKEYRALDLNGQGKLENWVGTGPFVVEKVDGTTGATLKRRDDYNWAPEGSGHTGKAYLSTIVFKTVPEGSTRIGALSSGEADIARNLAPADEDTVAANGGELVAIPIKGETNNLTPNLAPDGPAPLKDVKVREALQAATDRKEINEVALSPSYPVPTNALVKGTPNAVDESSFLTYDLDKARSLLDEDGWTVGADGIREKDGQKLHFDIWVAPFYQVSQPVLEVLQSQWKKAGVDLEIHSASLTQYTQIQTAGGDGKATWSFTQGQNSTADPQVLRTAFSIARANVLRFAEGKEDKKLQQLVEAQQAEFDTAKRTAAVKATEDYLFQQAYEIPLYDETQVFGLAPDVHGFTTESTGRSWLYDTWLSK